MKKKGFTLIEVIVVIVILAVIAAIALPSAISYIRNSKQNARIETARAIFNVAQNSMTKLYSKGDEGEIKAEGSVDISKIDPKIDSNELDNNKTNIKYICLDSSDSDKEGNPVYKLLDGHLSDASLLDDTILVEYNYKTGKVLSTFYSEERKSIGYGSGEEYNVYTRDKKTLKTNETGYWAVDSTGVPGGTTLDDMSAVIADYDGSEGVGNNINGGSNYGLLTCEITVPDIGPETYTYEITLNPESGTAKKIVIGPDEDIKWEDVNTSVADAVNGNGLYFEKSEEGKSILAVIMDTPYSAYSIKTKFPTLKPGNVTASVRAYLGGDSNTVGSNAAHTYYKAQSKDGNVTKNQVSSIRHLNNVRYDITSSANYVQTKDIKCRDYKNDILEFTPIGIDEGDEKNGALGFAGKYTGISSGKAYRIIDLTVTASQAGLFGRTSSTADINGVTIDYSENYLNSYESASEIQKERYFINSTNRYAGAICGRNYGIIRNCTVTGGKVRSTQGGEYGMAGGICGINYGIRNGKAVVKGCYNGADVYASVNVKNAYAGGICAFNYGDISYCENGTDRNETGMAGTPYFGARGSADYSYSGEGIKNDRNVISAANTGGICAYLYKPSFFSNGPTVRYCVNAGACKSSCYAAGYEPTYGGGICGQMFAWDSDVEYCCNAGSISNEGKGYLFTGGLIGGMTVTTGNTVSKCYNTGAVSCNSTASVDNAARAGGLAGHLGFGTISDCYSIGHITGSHSETTGSAFGYARTNGVAAGTNCVGIDTEPMNTESNGGNASFLSPSKLKTHDFAGMVSDGSEAGPFKYTYPHFDISNDDCKLGTDFHRTPWK